jgi:hypothetical protein
MTFGPGNPHPLSTLKTELVWEGKYDEYGNRRATDAAGLAMPLQTIETVDEPRSRSAPGLWDAHKAHTDDFRNMLIWGDNRLVMASLLTDYRGKVDLIYIDPPFDVGADFTMNLPMGPENDMAPKDQSAMEMVAYRDTWGKGTDSYIHMMYERLLLMRELLSESGSIFIHVDWRVSYLLRALLQEVFGRGNFISEIVWKHQIMGGHTAESSLKPTRTSCGAPNLRHFASTPTASMVVFHSATTSARQCSRMKTADGTTPEGA